jgi:hypothetical protein
MSKNWPVDQMLLPLCPFFDQEINSHRSRNQHFHINYSLRCITSLAGMVAVVCRTPNRLHQFSSDVNGNYDSTFKVSKKDMDSVARWPPVIDAVQKKSLFLQLFVETHTGSVFLIKSKGSNATVQN